MKCSIPLFIFDYLKLPRIKFGLLTLLFIGFLFSVKVCNGSHLYGGEITWKSLGNDSFEVTMNLYRDCNTYMDATNSIYVDCDDPGKKKLLFRKNEKVSSIIDITPVCKKSCTKCSSGSCSLKFGIERHTFRYIIYLGSSNCCRYRIHFHQAYRSTAITTGPAGDFYIEAILNKCIVPSPASPVFSYSPHPIFCKGEFVNYNMGIVNINQDSLGLLADSIVYALIPPRNDSDVDVSWINSDYDYDKPFYYYGFPNKVSPLPKGFHFDPSNGNLQFLPMKEEVTVMAIQAKEYKNGKIIAEVMRDMEFIVLDCNKNNVPFLSGINGSSNNYSINACIGDTVSFDVTAVDPDIKSGDTVTLSMNKGNLPGNPQWVTSNNGKDKVTGTFKWVPDSSTVNKIFSIIISAADKACPVYGNGQMIYQIHIYDYPQVNYSVSDSQKCGVVNFRASIKNNYNDFKWQIGDNLTQQDTFFSTQIKDTGNIKYSLEIQNQECMTKITDSFYLPPSYLWTDIGHDTTICKGDNISLAANVLNAKGKVKYLWQNGDTSSVLSLKNLKNDVTARLKVSDDECTFNDKLEIHVNNLPLLDIGPDTVLCNSDTFSIKINQSNDPQNPLNYHRWYYNYDSLPLKKIWTLDNNKILSDSDSIQISQPGTYTFKLIDNFDCFQSDSFYIAKGLGIDPLSDTFVCENENIIVSPRIINANGPVSYKWLSGSVSKTFKLSNVNKDTFTILSVKDNTCSVKDTIFVKAFPKPEVQVGKDILLCNTTPKQIQLASGKLPGRDRWFEVTDPQGLSFDWQNTTTGNAVLGDSILTINDVGTYRLIIKNSKGCSDEDSFKVKNQLIDAYFLAFPLKGKTPLEVQFYDSSSGTYNSRMWWFNDSLHSTSDLKNPKFTFEKEGSYTIKLLISDSLTGCADSFTREKYLSVTNPTSIKKIRAANNIRLIPNPAKDFVVLEFINPLNAVYYRLRVINNFGQTIYNQTFNAENIHQPIKIKTSSWAAGIYIFNISSDKDQLTQKKLIILGDK